MATAKDKAMLPTPYKGFNEMLSWYVEGYLVPYLDPNYLTARKNISPEHHYKQEGCTCPHKFYAYNEGRSAVVGKFNTGELFIYDDVSSCMPFQHDEECPYGWIGRSHMYISNLHILVRNEVMSKERAAHLTSCFKALLEAKKSKAKKKEGKMLAMPRGPPMVLKGAWAKPKTEKPATASPSSKVWGSGVGAG